MSHRFYANTTRFVPRPEKKGRNLRQIEEQFRMLDEKEKKLRQKFVEEDLAEEGNNSMNMSTMNNSSILSAGNDSINQSSNTVEGIDNTFIMTFEKRAKSTNSYHNPFRSGPPKPKPPKLIVVPNNTTTQFRSSLHLKQTARKRSQPQLFAQFSPNNTTTYSSEVDTEEEINIQDRTTLENEEEEQEEIAEELPTLFTLSSGMDPKVTEIFSFEVRVHQLAEHPNGLFDIKVYDEAKPFERVFVLKDLRINRECYIIFHEPSFIKFNALTLPWVERPENLVNHTIVVEVQGTYPTKTKIAKSTIKFSHNHSTASDILNRSKRSITPESKSTMSPSRSTPKILRLDNLPFTTTPSVPKEDDLQRSLSCIPVTSLSLKIQTPAVPVEEDLIQRHKLERSNSIDSQLSPSSQKYRQLQALRENMKLNLMLQQKLLS